VDGQAFSFGLVNELTREQYVLSGDAVFPVHPRYGMALPATAADAVSRQLFATGEVPVRIESRDFTVFLQDGKWTLAPGAAELSQDDLARWVDEWRLASALRVEPRATTKAQEQIRIQLKSGNPVTIGIIARAPELVLARADEKLQYYFRPELAKRLLSPPGVVGDPPAKR
jgi:hypothetical protein